MADEEVKFLDQESLRAIKDWANGKFAELQSLTAEYDAASTYSVGDLVVHEGVLYRCNADNTSGEWDSSKWDEVTIDTLFNNAKEYADEKDAAILALIEKIIDGRQHVAYADLANNLDSKVVQNDVDAYNFRTAGGALEIGDSCKEKAIIGGSLGFNQLIRNGDFSDGTRYWNVQAGGEITAENNVLTYTITSLTGDYSQGFGQFNWTPGSTGIALVKDHVYLNMFEFKASTALRIDANGDANTLGQGSISLYASTNWNSYKTIRKCTTNWPNANKYFSIMNSTTHTLEIGDTVSIRNSMFIDLTAMLGAIIADYVYALEQATPGAGVAWFRRYWKKPYYSYTAIGGFQHVKTRGKKIDGFNQFNRADIKSQAYTTVTVSGTTLTLTGQYYASWNVKLMANTVYYFRADCSGQVSTGAMRLHYTDGTISDATFVANQTFRPAKDVDQVYLYASLSGSSATTSYDKVCINFHYDGERDGEFEEYEEEVYENDPIDLIGIPHIDEQGNLYFEGNRYNSDGSVDEEWDEVDLGTLNWSLVGGYDHVFYAPLPSASIHQTLRLFTPKAYKPVPYYTGSEGSAVTSTNKSIKYDENGNIYIRDDDYDTAEAFETAMNGVYLEYPLKTPTQSEATPFQEPQKVFNWGTEERLNPEDDTRPCEVPVGHDTDYPLDIKSKVEIMPDLPSDDGEYVCKVTSGTAEYVPLSTWLGNNNYKQFEDLTSSLVKDADLYTTNKHLYKIGNMVFLSISAANLSGSAIAANTKLFTLPSSGFNSNADMNFAIEGGVCHINTSGELTVNKEIVANGRVDIYICFAIA